MGELSLIDQLTKDVKILNEYTLRLGQFSIEDGAILKILLDVIERQEIRISSLEDRLTSVLKDGKI